MDKKLVKFAIINFCIGFFLLVFTYLFYHFVTDAGISLTWHEEVGKPFVTNLIGCFGVLFVWSAVTSLLIKSVFLKKEK